MLNAPLIVQPFRTRILVIPENGPFTEILSILPKRYSLCTIGLPSDGQWEDHNGVWQKPKWLNIPIIRTLTNVSTLISYPTWTLAIIYRVSYLALFVKDLIQSYFWHVLNVIVFRLSFINLYCGQCLEVFLQEFQHNVFRFPYCAY